MLDYNWFKNNVKHKHVLQVDDIEHYRIETSIDLNMATELLEEPTVEHAEMIEEEHLKRLWHSLHEDVNDLSKLKHLIMGMETYENTDYAIEARQLISTMILRTEGR